MGVASSRCLSEARGVPGSVPHGPVYPPAWRLPLASRLVQGGRALATALGWTSQGLSAWPCPRAGRPERGQCRSELPLLPWPNSFGVVGDGFVRKSICRPNLPESQGQELLLSTPWSQSQQARPRGRWPESTCPCPGPLRERALTPVTLLLGTLLVPLLSCLGPGSQLDTVCGVAPVASTSRVPRSRGEQRLPLGFSRLCPGR